jgi:alginate O-acetyltransferase complex protein AlgI
MFFNSLAFLIFLIPTLILFWKIKRLRYQNIFLLFASYFFYSYWDWRFLFLLMFSTLLDYFSAIKIENTTNKKFWLVLSISVNLLFLGYFKYCNFFIESFNQFATNLGIKTHLSTLNIILPVGISFYTFHGLSYVIDVYKQKINAEHNVIDYSLFVCYFPLLVAGPIERTTHLLPQLKRKKKFDYSSSIYGLKQILWGGFKKVVIANQCALVVDFIYESPSNFHGLTMFFAALMFSVQIYCDFSGYTDMALGISRLFGIELLQNFHFPYFSKNIKEFWSKWHMSLSFWFRDYVYIPLGGNRVGNFKKFRNVMITFLLSGFWHGANWTFVVWGGIHGVFSHFSLTNLHSKFRLIKVFSVLKTFLIVTIAWIFFRTNTITDSFLIVRSILTNSFSYVSYYEFKSIFIENQQLSYFVILFFIIEFFSRNKVFGLQTFDFLPKILKCFIYYFLILLILFYSTDNKQFIYFQF